MTNNGPRRPEYGFRPFPEPPQPGEWRAADDDEALGRPHWEPPALTAAAGSGRSDVGSAPQRARLDQPGPSKRLAGLLWLSIGVGLLLNAAALAESFRDKNGTAEGLFWAAIVIPFVVQAVTLLVARPSARLRQLAIVLVGVYPTLIYRLLSPLTLYNYDEHLHQRELVDLLAGGGLLRPNPMLSIGPYYPGLELFTGTLVRLTGMSAILGINVVPLLCRLLFVLALYYVAITVLRSERAASLTVLLYAACPEFFNFTSKFAYETIALTLAMGGVLLLRRAQFKTGAPAQRLTILAVLAFIAMVMSHHVTSWLTFGFLVIWAIASPPAKRKVVTRAAWATGIAIALWTAAIIGKLTSYLGPVFSGALSNLSNILGGSAGGQLFTHTVGYTNPEWQRLLLVVYAAVCAIAAVVCGGMVLLRAIRTRDRSGLVLGLLCLIYPGTLAAHFVPSAAEIGDRASAFLFLPFALCVSLVVMRARRSRSTAGEPVAKYLAVGLIGLTSVVYLGGLILGAGASSRILPGAYAVESDLRSQDPYTLAAVQWASTHIAPGSRIMADRVPSNLFASEDRLWPIAETGSTLGPAYLYFSSSWGSYQTKLIKDLNVNYIYVDMRLDTNYPEVGNYFYPGEEPTEQRLTSADLSKFAHEPGLKVVYHLGPITIYSTPGFHVSQAPSGYTGNRPMGFGTIGDFILGVLLVGIIFALRSRLRWVAAAARDAGAVGGAVAVMSVTIMVAAVLFEFRLIPGAASSVGAIAAVVVGAAVARVRGHRLRLPRLRLSGLANPLAALGLTLAVAGILLAVRVSWEVDVTQVNQLLASMGSR